MKKDYGNKDNEREGDADNGATQQGNDEQRDSSSAGSEQEERGLLGGEVKEGGTPDTERKEGEKGNRIVKSVRIGATIPVVQYGNIQPVIEYENVTESEGIELGMSFIKELWGKHGEKPLKDNELKAIVSASVSLQSFNEDSIVVEFNPSTHEYTHKGRPLISATKYIKQFQKEFNTEKIAQVCEKSWGVPAPRIMELWDSGKEVTGEFGTVVHKALEFYENFKEVGEVIATKQGKGNPALPKHPYIRSIIEGFVSLEKPVGAVQTEVLITDIEAGICGRGDRILITGEKKCRVQDYKINVESEKEDKNNKLLPPWDILPSSKVSKYQLQLSVYANMLQKSGWEVEGLDVFVFEDKWKLINLPVLKVL